MTVNYEDSTPRYHWKPPSGWPDKDEKILTGMKQKAIIDDKLEEELPIDCEYDHNIPLVAQAKFGAEHLKDEPGNEGLFFHCVIGPLVISEKQILATAAKAFSLAYERLIGHKPNASVMAGGSGAAFVFNASDTRNILVAWDRCRKEDKFGIGSVTTLCGIAEAQLSNIQDQIDMSGGCKPIFDKLSDARKKLVEAIEILRGDHGDAK